MLPLIRLASLSSVLLLATLQVANGPADEPPGAVAGLRPSLAARPQVAESHESPDAGAGTSARSAPEEPDGIDSAAPNVKTTSGVGPASRTAHRIQGWEIRVDDRLLAPAHERLGRRALLMLEAKLFDITSVMSAEPLARLQAIPIVLDLEHGRLQAMQYHPSAAWLTRHGYSADLARCVHICQAADLVTSRSINEQPWVILHELAHAYHDQVLDFDEPQIHQAWQRFKTGGSGDQALLHDGRRVRHYALTDQKEFFAEMTEAYFGVNDFFPFNRAELMTAEPEIYDLLRGIWGPLRTGPAPLGDPL